MRRLGPHHWRAIALSALLVAALVVAFGSGVALLLAPALALSLLLVHGVFPGEQMIGRLRKRRRRPREHRAPHTVTAHRGVVITRTAWLAASPLAMRPPPVALPAISCYRARTSKRSHATSPSRRSSGCPDLPHQAVLRRDRGTRSLEEAILWHGGEAAAAMQRFRGLSRRERDDVIAFLQSL